MKPKEAETWSIDDHKKMINWKKFKADGATPARKNYLLVLRELVWERPKPTL